MVELKKQEARQKETGITADTDLVETNLVWYV